MKLNIHNLSLAAAILIPSLIVGVGLTTNLNQEIKREPESQSLMSKNIEDNTESQKSEELPDVKSAEDMTTNVPAHTYDTAAYPQTNATPNGVLNSTYYDLDMSAFGNYHVNELGYKVNDQGQILLASSPAYRGQTVNFVSQIDGQVYSGLVVDTGTDPRLQNGTYVDIAYDADGNHV